MAGTDTATPHLVEVFLSPFMGALIVLGYLITGFVIAVAILIVGFAAHRWWTAREVTRRGKLIHQNAGRQARTVTPGLQDLEMLQFVEIMAKAGLDPDARRYLDGELELQVEDSTEAQHTTHPEQGVDEGR